MLFAAHRGRLAFLTRAGREPSRPVGPPAALVLRGALEPLLRAAGVRVLDLPRPIGALAARWVDDARDVAAGHGFTSPGCLIRWRPKLSLADLPTPDAPD